MKNAYRGKGPEQSGCDKSGEVDFKGEVGCKPFLAAPKIEMICFTELHTLSHEMPGRMYRLTETPLFRHQSGASLRIFRCYIRRKTI